MFDDLLPYYEKELAYLSKEATLFARAHPQRAARLGIREESAESPDPHVERLIQAVALLAARVRMKVDDSFPELSDAIIELLFPHYLAPFPSTTIAQFQIDPERGRVTEPHRVQRKTLLETSSMDGVTCRFRTCYDTDVTPLVVETSLLESPLRAAPRHRAPEGIVSDLRLGLAVPGDLSIGSMGIERLRFYLHGEPRVTYGLHEMLIRHAAHVEIWGRDSGGRTVSVALPPSCLRPVGFEPEDRLIPYPRNTFHGFLLLQELFVLPEKFLFVDLTGLEALRGTDLRGAMEIHVYCRVSPPFHMEVEPGNFRLGCTPIVNLFEKTAEPIPLKHRLHEYPIEPDRVHEETTAAWSVQEVTSQPDDGSEGVDLTPLFAFGHGAEPGRTQLTWQARRRTDTEGNTSLWLTIGLPEVLPPGLGTQILSVRLLCTNGDLPSQLQFGADKRGDLFPENASGFLKTIALKMPTPVCHAPARKDAFWRLIAHLGLNATSLLADKGATLRGLLELYEPTNARAARQRIGAVRGVTGRPAERLLEGSILRGLKVEMTIDEDAFASTGHYLFSSVMDRFLAGYAAVNSFTQLRVTTIQNPEAHLDFPPRAGWQVSL